MYELHKNTCRSHERVNTSIFVSNLHLLLVIIVKCPNNVTEKKPKQIPNPNNPVQDSLLLMVLAMCYAGKITQWFLCKACISTMPQGMSWSLPHCSGIISPFWEGNRSLYLPVICNSVAQN